MAAQAKPTEIDGAPFKVLYEAPKRQEPKIAQNNAVKFKHSLPKYDYDKVMSRVKPSMQLHDHPSLELRAQAARENINFVRARALQAKKFK